jgi:hypothetical protein
MKYEGKKKKKPLIQSSAINQGKCFRKTKIFQTEFQYIQTKLKKNVKPSESFSVGFTFFGIINVFLLNYNIKGRL